jgi:hypothetical protein
MPTRLLTPFPIPISDSGGRKAEGSSASTAAAALIKLEKKPKNHVQDVRPLPPKPIEYETGYDPSTGEVKVGLLFLLNLANAELL